MFPGSQLAAGGERLPAEVNLLQTSISELADMLNHNVIKSVDLVKAYICMYLEHLSVLTVDNIEKHNINGYGLRAVIQVAPLEAVLQIAQALDDERGRGIDRGPLHGIPILVKDSIATHVELGMNTTAGSLALRMSPLYMKLMAEQSVVPGDAEVVRRLRAAGAISE